MLRAAGSRSKTTRISFFNCDKNRIEKREVQLGKFDEARALYEDFIAANPDSTWNAQAESGLLFLKKAERAKNAPAPVAVPAATETAAPAVEAAPAADAPAVDATAPAADENKSAQDESKPKKKKSSKKKADQPEGGDEGAGEPAAE